MIDLNRILLAGRLVADPVLKHLPTGTAIAEFRIAAGRKDKDTGKGDVVFINVAAFGKTADFCSEWLRKGSGVFIEGRLRHESWTDKDGNKREKITIAADRVSFGESKAEAEGRAAGHGEAKPADAPPARTQHAPQSQAQSEVPVETSDDLPF
jgi:single-strand DNA-binding protein